MLNRKSILWLALCAAGCGSSSGGAATAPSAPVSAPARQTIAEVTTATVSGAGAFAVGQSVTIPQTGSFNSILYMWLDRSGNLVPITATGTMYVLTQEYLGVARDLGTSTPGFAAKAVRVDGNAFVFDSSLTLTAGTKYWFLEDAAYTPTGVYTTQPHPDVYPGGDFYNAGSGVAGTNGLVLQYAKWFVSTPGDATYDANFRLTGTPVTR